MTREPVEPRGFSLDEYCVRVGSGRADFARGPEAVRECKMFDLGWLRVDPPGATIVEGTQVAVVTRHFGFWSVNWSQIVYVVDEDRRFGFAYGTLMDHAESGEDRFTVTLRPDGSVWYEIRALSTPRHALARLAYPLSRRLQKRFARESLAAVRRAVSDSGTFLCCT